MNSFKKREKKEEKEKVKKVKKEVKEVKEVKNKKEVKAPKNTIQFLWMIIVGIVKGIPRLIKHKLIRLVIVFVGVLLINTYLLAYKNEGYNPTPGNKWLQITAVRGNIVWVSANWTMITFFSMNIFYRIKENGLKNFIVDFLSSPKLLFVKAKESKESGIPTFFITTAIVLIITIFINNKLFLLLGAFMVFMSFTKREKGMLLYFFVLLKNDLKKMFKLKGEVNQASTYLMLFSVIFGFIISYFIKRALYIEILSVLLIALAILYKNKKISSKAISMLFVFFSVNFIYFKLFGKVYADDFGANEAGGTFVDLVKSPGGGTAIKIGLRPAAGSVGGVILAEGVRELSSILEVIPTMDETGDVVEGIAEEVPEEIVEEIPEEIPEEIDETTEEIYEEPETITIVTGPHGRESTYEKDPETGEWVNPETGGVLDVEAYEKIVKPNLEKDEAFINEQREKLETGDNMFDKNLKKEFAEEKIRRKQEKFRKILKDRYGTDKKGQLIAKISRNNEYHGARADKWNNIGDVMRFGEKASEYTVAGADVFIDGAANMTGPAGRSIRAGYKFTKSIAGTVAENGLSVSSVAGGAIKGATDAGSDFIKNPYLKAGVMIGGEGLGNSLTSKKGMYEGFKNGVIDAGYKVGTGLVIGKLGGPGFGNDVSVIRNGGNTLRVAIKSNGKWVGKTLTEKGVRKFLGKKVTRQFTESAVKAGGTIFDNCVGKPSITDFKS